MAVHILAKLCLLILSKRMRHRQKYSANSRYLFFWVSENENRKCGICSLDLSFNQVWLPSSTGTKVQMYGRCFLTCDKQIHKQTYFSHMIHPIVEEIIVVDKSACCRHPDRLLVSLFTAVLSSLRSHMVSYWYILITFLYYCPRSFFIPSYTYVCSSCSSRLECSVVCVYFYSNNDHHRDAR